MLRLISYSSVDSFIKRDCVLDTEVSSKVIEQIKKLASEHNNNATLNIFGLKLEHKRNLMTSEKGFFVQHRREYYNDFEDCIRDYKNAKIKSLQKQTKIHLSDGDNGESDSDYVDCNDSSSELKHQSALASKSMPHVLSGNYGDNFCQQVEILNQTTRETKCIDLEAQTQKPTRKAQLNTNYDDSKVAHKTSKQLPLTNNNLNQIIDSNSQSIKVIEEKLKERKQSIHNEPSTSTNDVHVNQKSTVETVSEVVTPTPVQTIVKKEELAKRKSCKKKANGETKDPTQSENRQMTVTSDCNSKKLDDASWGQEREILLERLQNNSFGISIVGGKVNVSGDALVSGIFIKNIIAGSSADQCGLVKVGDRILAVDGVDIRNSSHELAVKTIKNAGNKMTLMVQSLNAGNADLNSNDFVKKLPPPVTPVKTPLPEIIQEGSEKDDVVKDELKPLQDLKRDQKKGLQSNGGVSIDRASAGNVKRSKEEIDADPETENEFGYTTNKIKKRYGNLGTVLCHTIDRGANANIGISLAGHRDRNKMACFIAGINPKGIASSKSGLEIGDEILEANGIVLHGRCHLNASAIIKGLPGPVLQLIVLRRKQAVEDLAVKPVTQFPVEISNEDAFASFKNVRYVTIKKGNQSLGIMIIEGKHAEVGQGIFVSDIQEMSNAEKAGLNIGDMLLAVNKDSLLGCNYETAASMLKKTEGIVVLTVCNPNKKDSKDTELLKDNVVELKDPSRPVTPKPQPSPAKETPADPSTCEIAKNQNTLIEIKLENQPIGIQVAGGSNTMIAGAIIVNIIPGSIAEKDKRLQVFDQILDINTIKMTPELTSELIQRAVKNVQSKVKMTIYRADPSEVENIDIELTKKGGKNLGLGFFTSNPHGLLVTDIIPGGLADLDGRIQKSDIVTHVNSDKISNMSLDDCAILLKTAQGKVSLKVMRAKPKKRS